MRAAVASLHSPRALIMQMPSPPRAFLRKLRAPVGRYSARHWGLLCCLYRTLSGFHTAISLLLSLQVTGTTEQDTFEDKLSQTSFLGKLGVKPQDHCDFIFCCSTVHRTLKNRLIDARFLWGLPNVLSRECLPYPKPCPRQDSASTKCPYLENVHRIRNHARDKTLPLKAWNVEKKKKIQSKYIILCDRNCLSSPASCMNFDNYIWVNPAWGQCSSHLKWPGSIQPLPM